MRLIRIIADVLLGDEWNEVSKGEIVVRSIDLDSPEVNGPQWDIIQTQILNARLVVHDGE